jgi:hypothetical protein
MMSTEAPAPTPGGRQIELAPKARSMHPPEVAARIVDFTAKLGPSLVANLNRNVLHHQS